MRFSYIKSAKFSAANRLLRDNGFKHVLCAEKVADNRLRISFSKNGLGNSRLGIVVSKKNFSKAVVRNRIKRIIREAFRQHPIKVSGLDIVVLVKKTFLGNNKINNSNLDILFNQIENKCADL